MLNKSILLISTIILLHGEEIDTPAEIELFVMPSVPLLSESNMFLKEENILDSSNSAIIQDTLTIYVDKDTGSRWMKMLGSDSTDAEEGNDTEGIPGYRMRQLISELDWTEILNAEEQYMNKKNTSTEVDIDTEILICENDGESMDPYARYDGRPGALFQSMTLDRNPKWGMYDELVNKREQSGSCYIWNHNSEYYEWKKYKLLHETVKKYMTVKVHLPYKVKFRPFAHRHSIGFQLVKILH